VQFNDLKAQHARHASEIEARMQAVLRHAQFIMGPEVAELEHALAERVGATHCVTVSSGTQALELALRGLDVGPGDEVITTAFSWISSAEVIPLVGATPVFADIEPVGLTLDAGAIAAKITPRTRAILAVSLYGQLPDLSAIAAIADAHGLPVIEDGAQSFGAKQRGRSSGGLTRVGCTSFFPSKPLGCYGDGGAIFTSDAELGQRLRALRTHGSVDRREHTLVGTNARLDTLQAAVLLGKLPYFDAELVERRRLAARYSKALEGRFVVPQLLAGNEHVFAQYTLRHPERDALCRALAERDIPTQVHYRRGLHQQPVFAHLCAILPETERAAREVFSLPLYPGLADAEQDRVIEALLSAVEG
jgi:UDP-2-acetamido-2-deoxy-ribo-hexuluronate aminotransferase